MEEGNLLKGKGCACCCNPSRIVVEGINDIPTTSPWLIKYFQGGYDEAKLYTKSSNHKFYPICPDCGRIKDKEMNISTIYDNHSIGCSCGDSFCYPERIMYSVLEQVGVDFIKQLNKTTFNWCGSYKYDFYIPSLNCIIETHGGQHYKESGRGRTLKKEQENDRVKKQLALENGIKEGDYIVIDCRKSELEWIKNSVLNSKLNELLHLSVIDWGRAEELSLSNLVKKACELKKDNPNTTSTELGEIMKLDKHTIIRYLRKGTKLGWCEYDSKKESVKNNVLKRKQVEIFKDGLSLGIFNGCCELETKSEEIFGVKLLGKNISEVCNGRQRHHKGFTFKYIKYNKEILI